MNLADFLKILYLSKTIPVSERVAKLLLKRGHSLESIDNYLFCKRPQLHSTHLLPDIGRAVEVVADAIKSDKGILIYGDFDADGITSTAVLYSVLRQLTGNVRYFIPHRMREGYDLSIDALERIAKGRDEILITVDCGIKAISQIQETKDLFDGIVILDHHNTGDRLPDADAIVDAKREDSEYPFRELAGVGVVYKFITALKDNFSQIEPDDYLDLVAIGTVADVVPLLDENRCIVKEGLEKLSQQIQRPGIKALIEVAGLKGKTITSWYISFVLAPRLNSAGRLSDPSIAVRLLLESNEDKAIEIAKDLEAINRERREIGERVLMEAKEMLESKGDVEDFIILSNTGWHPGVIGIVASRITEEYLRPTALISEDVKPARGSARSVGGLDLTEALNSQREYLVRFGGHCDSAGFSINKENIDDFRKGIIQYASKRILWEDLYKTLDSEFECSISEIDKALVESLQLLEPFGEENPEPKILVKNARIVGSPAIVGEKHLKFRIKDSSSILEAINFNSIDHYEAFSENKPLNITGTPYLDKWGGIENLGFKISDFEISEEIQDNRVRFNFLGYEDIQDIENSLIITDKELELDFNKGNYILYRNSFINRPVHELFKKFSNPDINDEIVIERVVYLTPPFSWQEMAIAEEIAEKKEVFFAFGIEDIKRSIDNLYKDLPDRENLKKIYRNIRKFANKEEYIKDYERFLEEIKGELNKNGSSIALRIFKDIGLMTIEGEEKRIEINENSGDFNLYHSYVFRITRALYDTRSKFLNDLLKSIET